MSRVALACALLLPFVSPRVTAAQSERGGVTYEEEREARAVALAFSKRLEETQEFAVVVGEMYAKDFMSHNLKREAGWAENSSEKESEAKTFRLEGVPALSFEMSLAAREDDEYWPRLYAAAYDMLRLGGLALLSKRRPDGEDDPETTDEELEKLLREAYPPEAVRILDSNPALANLLKRNCHSAAVKTPEELREVTLKLEEAARLTRASLAGRPPSGESLASEQRMLNSLAATADVSLVKNAEAFGYAKGTRLFRIFTSAGYILILVKEGGTMKVAWTTFPYC